MTTGNDREAAEKKVDAVERVSKQVTAQLRAQELTAAAGSELERHAYSVNDRIRDASLRNMHILTAV